MCKDWVPPEVRLTSQADLGSAYRLAPQSLVSKLLRGSFRGIAVDIQTKEQAKTTIYLNVLFGCDIVKSENIAIAFGPLSKFNHSYIQPIGDHCHEL